MELAFRPGLNLIYYSGVGKGKCLAFEPKLRAKMGLDGMRFGKLLLPQAGIANDIYLDSYCSRRL